MLIKNIMVSENHCNGVRYRIRHVGKSILILDPLRPNTKPLFLPRVNNKSELNGFKFTRRQYPIHIGFAATSNKMQGNSVGIVGLVDEPNFENVHGFHYVSLTRHKNSMFYVNKRSSNRSVISCLNSDIISRFEELTEK
jgi:hypothetical protein